MGPILIDVRGLQRGTTGETATGLLRSARPSLPGRVLIGLVDPCLPPLEAPMLACLDQLCTAPHAAQQAGPECFVRLAPDEDQPLFTARLLLDAAIPSVSPERPDRSLPVARYWRSCVDVVVPGGALWTTAAGLRAARKTTRLVVSSATPDLPLCRALRRCGADIFPPHLLPALSPQYDHTLFILSNAPASAAPLKLLRRYGGSAVLLDSSLLAAYDPEAAAELAARELGRPVPAAELLQWQESVARPPALLLEQVAAAADRLFVHSAWLADEIAHRHRREAIVLPTTPDLPRLRAHAAGLQAESCVWAIEMLRSWGRDLRLDLITAPGEMAALTRLAARLGVADLVGFESGPASLTLFLSMRGQASLSALLAGAEGPCITSAGVAEAVDRAGTIVLPDQPSPPLLAAAIDEALPARDELAAARLLMAALQP